MYTCNKEGGGVVGGAQVGLQEVPPVREMKARAGRAGSSTKNGSAARVSGRTRRQP
jgi:hypothetical protein